MEGEVLSSGDRNDDEWESYIREKLVAAATSYIEHGVRWLEFFEHCKSKHKKRGGSYFRHFAKERFEYSAPVASKWVNIGRSAEELFRQTKKFAADQDALYEFPRLSDDQQNYLLSQDGLITQKAIKALKGTRGDHSSDKANTVVTDPDVRDGDFREKLTDIEPGSVRLILTDPPYPKKFLHLWSDLGKFAADKLADDGILIAYSGKYMLPNVLNALSEHLTYWWMSAIFLEGPGHSTPLGNPVRKVISQWRPLVMFVRKGVDVTFQDVVPAGGKMKDNHNWGQAESESAWIVEKFTRPGDLVVDPMAGSGTVAKACRGLGRNFIGANKNADE